mmetsp:Transcript_6252/g.12432  ORF Transcript_6252/g.12432 Transcript_6252/m.12432 type:complete len:231 (+) Transcript_6252:1285-1977(+)
MPVLTKKPVANLDAKAKTSGPAWISHTSLASPSTYDQCCHGFGCSSEQKKKPRRQRRCQGPVAPFGAVASPSSWLPLSPSLAPWPSRAAPPACAALSDACPPRVCSGTGLHGRAPPPVHAEARPPLQACVPHGQPRVFRGCDAALPPSAEPLPSAAAFLISGAPPASSAARLPPSVYAPAGGPCSPHSRHVCYLSPCPLSCRPPRTRSLSWLQSSLRASSCGSCNPERRG